MIASREDPTDADRDETRVDPRRDAAAPASPEPAVTTLPARAAFRRRRGLTGDVVYVGTVLFGSAAARREQRRLEAGLDGRRRDRDAALVALGADGLGEPALDDAYLVAARDALAALEEDRAARTGQIAAAEADAVAIERNKKGELERQAEAVKAIDAELTALAGRLAPLEREVEAVRKRGDALRATLAKQDDELRTLDARAVAMRGKAERAGVDAEIASVRADRVAVSRDEPVLAAELAVLSPQVAALEAERTSAQRRLAEAKAAIVAAGERAADELAAVAATRKVIDRGIAEVERQRDRALRELGERLASERPDALAAGLARVDAAERAAATDDDRARELRELLATVDRAAVARGVAVVVLTLAAIGALVWWLALRR